MAGNNRIMIFGPKSDGTYVVEFRTAGGETLVVAVRTTHRPCSGSEKNWAISKAKIAATVTRMQNRNCDR